MCCNHGEMRHRSDVELEFGTDVSRLELASKIALIVPEDVNRFPQPLSIEVEFLYSLVLESVCVALFYFRSYLFFLTLSLRISCNLD